MITFFEVSSSGFVIVVPMAQSDEKNCFWNIKNNWCVFIPNLVSDLGHEFVNNNTPNLCLLLQSRHAPAAPILSVPNGLDAV